jgi:hypothetical protein
MSNIYIYISIDSERKGSKEHKERTNIASKAETQTTTTTTPKNKREEKAPLWTPCELKTKKVSTPQTNQS